MEHRLRAAESTGRLARLEVELAKHRHAEEELRQSGERFRLLIEHGREYVFRYSFQLQRFDYISPGIADLCGYSAAEFFDNPQLILDIIHGDDSLLLQQYIDAGDFSKPLALRCLRRDGSVIWLEQRSLPSYDGRGQLLVLEGILRDVSNYRHLLEDAERNSARRADRWVGRPRASESPLPRACSADRCSEVRGHSRSRPAARVSVVEGGR